MHPPKNPIRICSRHVSLALSTPDGRSRFDHGKVQDGGLRAFRAFCQLDNSRCSLFLEMELDEGAGIQVDNRHRNQSAPVAQDSVGDRTTLNADGRKTSTAIRISLKKSGVLAINPYRRYGKVRLNRIRHLARKDETLADRVPQNGASRCRVASPGSSALGKHFVTKPMRADELPRTLDLAERFN